MTKLRVELLLTGNELMCGDVIDSNSAFIAQQLATLGLEVTRRVTVKDDITLLRDEIVSQSTRADILIINGGLGPTVDDMTAQALSLAADVPIECHPQALAHLQAWCERRNYPLNEPNKKQAMLPKGCDVIHNETGSAPGFVLSVNDCLVYTTPGVPRELKKMLCNEILPHIRRHNVIESDTHISHFGVFGLGESTIQEMVNDSLPDWPTNIELGYRAAMPNIEIKLTSHDKHAHEIKPIWQEKLLRLLGAHVIGLGRTTMPQALVDTLLIHDKSVTFAESCTGGLMASQLTGIAGSSAVFEAGFVTYSNAIKTSMLGVDKTTLVEHGAVSEPVVMQMLNGALLKSGADFGVAVSGIAGPGGGSEEKPVGLVWIAWGSTDNIQTAALYLPLGRQYFQQYVAAVGLDLIKRCVIGESQAPVYLAARKATLK